MYILIYMYFIYIDLHVFYDVTDIPVNSILFLIIIFLRASTFIWYIFVIYPLLSISVELVNILTLIYVDENKHFIYRTYAYISQDIYPWTWYHTDNSSYTRVTPRGKKSVVSDNTWINEYSIAPLIYHWYTNQFLCYSLDIILWM